MENETYWELHQTSDLFPIFLAKRFSNSWLWGTPEGLSDDPLGFRQFIEETPGLTLIESTQVIRIDEIETEEAAKLAGFLRNPPMSTHVPMEKKLWKSRRSVSTRIGEFV